MNIQTDRALIPADRPAVRYLTVTLTAPDPGRRADRPAVNVALVLDRSGSMAGRKLEMARQAVERAIRLLDERDRLAVVCYDNEIETLLGSTTASAEAKANALARLREIDARGSTDLCGGWLRGAEEIDTRRDTNGAAGRGENGPAHAGDVVTRVLLLSDGLANVGETDPDTLAARAAALRERGVGTSTFGLGADFDETLMSRLATDGGGHFYFIEQPAQIADVLHSELGDALDVVARDARLVLSVPAAPGPNGRAAGPDARRRETVKAGVVNDLPVEVRTEDARGDDVHVRLGDLVAGQEGSVVVAVAFEPHPEGATASVSLRLADRDGKLFPHPLRVDWRAVDAEVDAAQPINGGVLVAAATQIAARARGRALDHNRRGDYAGASEVLKAGASAVRAIAGDIAGRAGEQGIAEALKALERLASELERDENPFSMPMHALARKAVHFEAYALSRARDPRGRARKTAS